MAVPSDLGPTGSSLEEGGIFCLQERKLREEKMKIRANQETLDFLHSENFLRSIRVASWKQGKGYDFSIKFQS
jgi:hypothetical protein